MRVAYTVSIKLTCQGSCDMRANDCIGQLCDPLQKTLMILYIVYAWGIVLFSFVLFWQYLSKFKFIISFLHQCYDIRRLNHSYMMHQ